MKNCKIMRPRLVIIGKIITRKRRLRMRWRQSYFQDRERYIEDTQCVIKITYVFFWIKIYLLEERKAAVDDRLKLTTNQLDSTTTSLETVDGRRIDMVKVILNVIIVNWHLSSLMTKGDEIRIEWRQDWGSGEGAGPGQERGSGGGQEVRGCGQVSFR